MIIESTITRVGRSSFEIRHNIMKDGKLAVEGNETRAWVESDPNDRTKLRSKPLPDDLAARFQQD